ncbi:MAG: hypothetical protein WEB13_00215 [Dehalococcoidia bacterium]
MTPAGSAPATPQQTAALPLLTLDFDGVICAPILGRNIGIHRSFLDPGATPRPARLWPRRLADPWDHLRYDLRRPLPEAGVALATLARVRRLIVLTGRRSSPERWLRRYGLRAHIERVVINEGPLRSPHFKLHAVAELGAAEHVDDDPRTAQLLAQQSAASVYLRDWPKNRGLPYDAGIARVHDLAELAARLAPVGGR